MSPVSTPSPRLQLHLTIGQVRETAQALRRLCSPRAFPGRRGPSRAGKSGRRDQVRRGPPCAQLRPRGRGPVGGYLVTWAWPGRPWARAASPGHAKGRRDAQAQAAAAGGTGSWARDLHPLTMFEGRFSKLLQKLAFWELEPQKYELLAKGELETGESGRGA